MARKPAKKPARKPVEEAREAPEPVAPPEPVRLTLPELALQYDVTELLEAAAIAHDSGQRFPGVDAVMMEYNSHRTSIAQLRKRRQERAAADKARAEARRDKEQAKE